MKEKPLVTISSDFIIGLDSHVFNVSLATEVGLTESIILQHFYFLYKSNKENESMIKNGNVWFFRSVKSMNETYPYLTTDKIRRAIERLVNGGLVYKADYNTDKFKKVTWYSLSQRVINMFNGEKTESILQNTNRFGNMPNDLVFSQQDNNNINNNNIDNKKDNSENKFSLSTELSITAKDISVDIRVFKKVNDMLSSVVFPFDNIEFKKKFFILCCMPKWRTKTIHAIQMQLNKLQDYEIAFVMELIDNSIMNEWQGIVYQDTPKRYQEWLRTKGSEKTAGAIKQITDPEERENMIKYLDKNSELWN